MQTTLLGFAIAIILALVAALVGPFFVDWGHFRGEFEERASRLTGLEFHVTGAIDARLLPTPTLMLHGIEFGRPGETGKVSARSLRLEFALGSFVRGEWKIADARLEAPDLVAGIDESGRIAVPVPSVGFDPEGVSVQRLTIEEGRATLTDAGSASRIVLDQIEFKGELRSLTGPVKGEGSFVVDGQHYPYRVNTSRVGDEGGVKVRLAIDPIDRPVTAVVDLSVAIEQGVPRFEGTLAFARSVTRAPEGAQALIIEPWRVTSRIKGDSAAAVLEQIEFQYGPDDRAVKLRGDAKIAFGARPQLDGVFSSTQIDLDRVLDLPDAMRRRPLIAIKSFADNFASVYRLPFPVRLGVNVETLTLAGAALQRVSADVKTDAETWDIESLEFRAPGITQVRLSGRFGAAAKGISFNGPAKIESADPRAFVAWLADRADAQFSAADSLRVSGDVRLGSETIAVDWLKIELDRMAITGRFDYSWAGDDRPARLDAVLTAPELNVDRVQSLAKAVLGGTEFDWPREGTLSLKVDRASLGGVDVKGTNVDVRLAANGFGIERLTIADLGGAALAVKGRIDNHSQAPRGEITLDLDARSLDGVTALVEKFAPAAAEQLRRTAERFAPVKLRALLSMDPDTPDAARVTSALAKFKVDGSAGAFRLALHGDAAAAAKAFALPNLADLGAAKVNVSGRLDADDGAILVELAGLDRILAVDKRPGRLELTAKGALDGELAVNGQLLAGALSIATKGTVRLTGSQSKMAGLDLKIANANVRSLRAAPAGRPAELLPMSGTARLAFAEGTVTLTDIAGSIAGTSVGGRLIVGTRKPMNVAGDIEIGALDLPTVLAAALGTPVQGARGAALWSAEPFETSLPDGLSGRIALKSARVGLAPKLIARDVRGIVQFGGSELLLQELEGTIAGGQIGGELAFMRRPDGLAARGRARLSGVNGAELVTPLTGRLTLDISASGSGKSPAALIGSLGGSGSFTLEHGQVTRFDPMAFAAVIRAVDQGLPIDVARVRDRMEAALAGGNLPIALAEGAITINTGQARLSNTVVRAQGADLAVGGSINLADSVIDARLTLSGSPGPDGASTGQPQIVVTLKGPFDAPKRAIDATAFASWLALRAVEQQAKKLDALEGHGAAPSVLQRTAPAQGAPPPAVPAANSAVAPVPGPAATSGIRSEANALPPAAEVAPPVAEVAPPAPEVAPPPTPRPRPAIVRARPKAHKPRTATAPLDLRPGSPPIFRSLDLPRLFQ